MKLSAPGIGILAWRGDGEERPASNDRTEAEVSASHGAVRGFDSRIVARRTPLCGHDPKPRRGPSILKERTVQAMIKKATALLGILAGAWAVMAGAVVFVWYAVRCAGRVVGWLP